MAKLLFIPVLFLATLFPACSKNNDSTAGNSALAGKWTLVETLADPGDGSGTWQPVDATKHYFLKFNVDYSIESNAYPGLGGLKHYQVVNDSTVIFIYANNSKFTQFYKINNSFLTLMGGCVEACGLKYTRTDYLNEEQN